VGARTARPIHAHTPRQLGPPQVSFRRVVASAASPLMRSTPSGSARP
jgi:hypothetical protein